MKIEIDLKDILQDDDYGSETMQESIRRQVVEKLQSDLAKGITNKIDEEVSKAINEQIKKALDEIRPNLIKEILDTPYFSVDKWGSRAKESTTFRNQLVKSVHEQMIYQKTNYPSERNAFTKAVDEVLQNEAKAFETQFKKLVDDNYVAQTKAYAVKVLKEKLGF